jgi:hypothetical protein
VNYRNWQHFNNKPQGEGFKIAYEPLDVAALPKNHQSRYHNGKGLLNGSNRFIYPAPEGIGMRLLREALSEPYRPPVWEKRVNDGDGEESDDEGDLFMLSYRECSGTAIMVDGPPVEEQLVMLSIAGGTL